MHCGKACSDRDGCGVQEGESYRGLCGGGGAALEVTFDVLAR